MVSSSHPSASSLLGTSVSTEGFGASSSILSRRTLTSTPAATPIQSQVDGLVGGFVHQATDWRSLAAMMAGGMAYRIGKIGVMGLGSGSAVRAASVGLGLTAEVSLFELTHRGLSTLAPHPEMPNSNLWRWEGTGGLRQGFINSFITFGTLKSAGHLARTENVVVQHLSQDVGMVLGHQVSGALHLAPRPEGSLAEQLLHAEATNLQIGAGMSLAHRLAPGIQGIERGLDLSLQARNAGSATDGPEGAGIRNPWLQPAFAVAESPSGEAVARPPSPDRGEGLRGPSILAMATIHPTETGGPRQSGGGSSRPPPSSRYAEMILRRATSLPTSSVLETATALRREWQEWSQEIPESALDAKGRERIEAALPHYSRFAMAHLGKETPAQLPFIQEVYEMTAAAFLSEGRQPLSEGERSILIRFLSEQPGRRLSGEGVSVSMRPETLLTFEQTRNLLGDRQARWETFLRREIDRSPLPPSERAQAYQRGLALMHFYAAHLHREKGEAAFSPASRLLFDPHVLQQCLAETSRHPYPIITLESFFHFFRKVLGETGSGVFPIPSMAGRVEAREEMEPLEASVPPFLELSPGETWPEHLTRAGITRGQLDVADLSVAGATIFAYGTRRDCRNILSAPGDILPFHGVITYLNAGREKGVDPYHAIRLALPEQLSGFKPDAQGNVVIRFPKLLSGLDYAHFGLGALLRAHLQTTPEAHDMDLARQWGVHESTVSEYRRGIVRKMRLVTMERLVEGLSPPEATDAQKAEIRNLLMFLRYRSFFDANLSIVDQDGTLLNRRPPIPSRYRIVLATHEENLRPLDLTRRIRFEREPFASALNGTVDLSLELLETRRREFEILGDAPMKFTEGDLSLEAFRERIRVFRERHALYFQKLSEQGRSPGVVRPGELREIQDFYREIFRFFEKIHLHTRPTGELSVAGTSIHYEIVPPTPEHVRGVRFEADPENSNGLKAFVVAADLVENGRTLSDGALRDLVTLRVTRAYLRRFNLLLPGEEHASANEAVLQRALSALPQSGEISWAELSPHADRLETQSEAWSAPLVNPSEQAFLHRILRGKISEGGAERRALQLQEDLRAYASREAAVSLLPELQTALALYLSRAPHPSLHFDRESFEAALVPEEGRERGEVPTLLREHLTAFLKSRGLPSGDNGSSLPSATAEGLANLAFLGYLAHFRENHPLRWQGQLIEDPVLLERMIDERLVDAPQFVSHRDRIAREMSRLVAEYNRRTPPLRIFEIAAQDAYPRDPLLDHPLSRIYDQTLEGLERPSDAILTADSRRLIYSSFNFLRETLDRGESPSAERIAQSLENGARRLNEMGIAIDSSHRPEQLLLLSRLVERARLSLESIYRLRPQVGLFVRSRDYHSGLDDAHDLSRFVENIFRRHLTSALLDAEPMGLPAALRAEIQGRFGPYPTLREDLIRGLTIIYHETLQSLREDYDQLSTGLEMSREDAGQHGDRNQFRQDLLGLATEVYPELKDFSDLVRRTEDLEVLLSLLPNGPVLSFRDRVREAEGAISLQEALAAPRQASMKSNPPRPIEAEPPPVPRQLPPQTPPIDPARILSAPVLPHWLERYPELRRVQEAELLLEIQEERRHVVEGEGRSVLQLIALLNTQRVNLNPESRDILDQMILEVETSPEPVERITEEAFARYDSIRDDLMNQIPVLDRVGLYPELRNGEETLQGVEAGRSLQNFLSRRHLANALSRMVDKTLETHFDSINSGNLQPYLEALSRIYLENREALRGAAELKIAETDNRPLDPSSPPDSLKERLRREAPELDLFEDARLQEALEEALVQTRGIPADFWSQSGSYLLLKLRCLLSNQFGSRPPAGSPLIGIGIQMHGDYRRLTAMAAAGGSLPHLAALGTDRIMERYRQHRPAILDHLIQNQGPERLLQLFPETRRALHPPLPAPWKGLDVPLPTLPQFEIFARIANRLLSRSTNFRHQRAAEQILSSLIPPNEGAPTELALESLQKTAETLMAYYIRNREELRHSGSDRPSASLESIRDADKSSIAPLWELAAYPEAAVQERRELIQTFLREPWEGEMRYLFRFLGPEGDQHERIFSSEEIRQIQEAFAIGRGVNLGLHGEWELTSQNHLGTVPMTPFNRARYILKAMLSDEMLHLNEFALFASQGVPDFYRAMDGDLSRAAGWLMMGVDPVWILPTLRDRWLKTYQSHREEVSNHLNFVAAVSDLPEVQAVPSYAMEMGSGNLPSLKSLNYGPDLEMVMRVSALLAASGSPDRTAFRKLAERWQKDRPEYFSNAARFYLERRRQILPRLRPWLPQELISEVLDLPEVKSLNAQDTYMNAVHLPRSYSPSQPENELILKLVTLIYQDHVPSTIRREADLLIQRAGNESAVTLTPRVADFYLKNREDILPRP